MALCARGRTPNDHGMGGARAIIRVFCVDGPLRGVHFLDEESGIILFDQADGRRHVYRIKVGERVITDFGPCPAAHFQHSNA
jgi:hypothetical protein